MAYCKGSDGQKSRRGLAPAPQRPPPSGPLPQGAGPEGGYFIGISSYCLLPRPISSAWARQVLYSELGVAFSKWS